MALALHLAGRRIGIISPAIVTRSRSSRTTSTTHGVRPSVLSLTLAFQ
jgi:hypothetical protein